MHLKLALLLSMTLCLASCKQEFNGSLKVTTPMVLISKQGQQVSIQTGVHNSKIKIVSKNKLELALKSSSGEIKFPLKTSQNLKNITNGTRLYMPAKESGQPYHVSALYTVTQSSSAITRTTEACVYYRSEYSCRTVYIPPTCRTYTDCSRGTCVPVQHCTPGGYTQECGYFNVPYNGYQDVEYYYVTTSSGVTGNFLHPSNNVSVADFRVVDQDSVKNYTYQGICR